MYDKNGLHPTGQFCDIHTSPLASVERACMSGRYQNREFI